MDPVAHKTQISGKESALFSQIVFFSIVIVVLFSIVLAWNYFLTFAFTSLCFVIPALILMFAAFSRDNQLTLNWHLGQLEYRKKSLALRNIKKIRITTDRKYFNIRFFFKRRGSASVFSVDSNQLKQIQEDLRAFQPQYSYSMIHRKNISERTIMMFILLVFLADMAAIFNYKNQFPLINIVPRKVEVAYKMAEAPSTQSQYRWKQNTIRLPSHYVNPIFSETDFSVHNTLSKAIFNFSTSFYDQQTTVFRGLMRLLFRVKNSNDFFKLGFESSGGILPLMLKHFLFLNIKNIRVYKFNTPRYQGYIVNGQYHFPYRKIWMQNKIDLSNIEIEIFDNSPRKRISVLQILNEIQFKHADSEEE